jgi:Fe-S-cluster-containing dehydrogenase component
MAERVTLRQAAPVRWAKVVDQTRCIGCHACTTACKSENEVPLGPLAVPASEQSAMYGLRCVHKGNRIHKEIARVDNRLPGFYKGRPAFYRESLP